MGLTTKSEDVVLTRYVANRPAYTQVEFEKHVSGEPEQPVAIPIHDKVKDCFGNCNGSSVLNWFLGFFPILEWMRHYKFKKWIGGDIVSGITVGIVHIPQSMAFSLLAGLPAVFGIYTSFWTVLIYSFMGTSRQLSVGTFAVTSLLTQEVVIRYSPEEDRPVNMTNGTILGLDEYNDHRVRIASAVMLLMGVFQLIFSIFRLGAITKFMSDALIQGFTTGAALHVLLSQMPAVFGIQIKPFIGIGSFYLRWIDVFRNLPNSNVATIVLSIICTIILVTGRHINLKYQDKLKVPLPTEVLVVIVSIIISYFVDFETTFGIAIVKDIPIGFPTPVVPEVSILGEIVDKAFGLAVVGFAINISVSKFYAVKYNYKIDANQELLAYGMTNLIPSFFSCFPNAAALARCQIQDQSGGKTQVVGLIASVILVVTITAIGKVFEPLPTAALGCIISVGLIGVIAQIGLIPSTYRKSKADCLVWVFTFLAICSIGVDYGLFASIGFAMFVFTVRTQNPTYEVQGAVADTDIYKDSKTFKTANPILGIVVFKYNAMLYYINKDHFKTKLYKSIGFDPEAVLKIKQKRENRRKTEEKKLKKRNSVVLEVKSVNGTIKNDEEIVEMSCDVTDLIPNQLHTVVIDCCAFAIIDMNGAKILRNLYKIFEQLDIEMLLANVNDSARSFLRLNEYFDIAGEDSEFLTVHDAVLYAQTKRTKSDDLIA